MFDFTFEYPFVFAILILFIIGAKFFKMRFEAILFPHLDILNVAMKNQYINEVLKWITIIGLVIALASPVIEDEIVETNKDGYDIVLSLDASYSMSEAGFDLQNRSIDKFSIVKEIVGEFIHKRDNDNIGFIVFADFAYVASPLTFDKDILSEILEYLEIGIAGKRTAIYDSIAQSVKILKESEAKSKMIILLTDGENTAGQIPIDVSIDLAKKYNIKIHSIAIGRYFNTLALKKLSKETGGKFFIATDKNMLLSIYSEIDKLEKSEIKSEIYVKKEYFYHYPLTISIIAFFIFIYLRNRRF